MNGKGFIGKWKWENMSKDLRYIEFTEKNGKIELRVYNDGILWEGFKNLNVSIDKNDDGEPISYTFHNGWLSKDGKKFFQCELSTAPSSGNFVNAMEFELIEKEKIKHVIKGYSFDSENESWEPFESEAFMLKI